jgi:4-carboxymuconolactone decarboxylase
MKKDKLPVHFLSIKRKQRKFFNAVDRLGKVAREEGPLDEKTAHLIQLGAATALRSEGAVHSHAITLLITTVGFPTVAAALSWADDVMSENEG